jgi:DNA-binding XRE family transcriptional regulator
VFRVCHRWVFIGGNFQVSSCRESPWIHCNFFTKPKINLTIQRPQTLPDGYPLRPKTLGERLKKKRLDMELFQKDVAQIVGVSADTVTNWERGRTKPSKHAMIRIQQFLEN